MKNRILSAASLIVPGILIAIGPETLFKVCASMGNSHMACYYTARAEIGVGALIAALGVLLLVFKSDYVRIGISFAAILASILSILLPTALTGVCSMATMACRKATLPALIVLGVLTIVFSAANLFYLSKQVKKADLSHEKR